MSHRPIAKYSVCSCFILCFIAVLAPTARGQEDEGEIDPQAVREYENYILEVDSIPWKAAGSTHRLAGVAEVKVPEGMRMTGRQGVREILRITENLADPTILAAVAPEPSEEFADPLEWFALISWVNSGYVKDDEEIDADELLKVMQEQAEAGNVERKKQGLETLSITGWHTPPHYEQRTKNLEWGKMLKSGSGVVVNYEARVLGRRGYLSVLLVAETHGIDVAVKEMRRLLASTSYLHDETYADYREGDKVSEYGLAALVAGGGLAAALKLGFFQKFWKFILVGCAAVGGFFVKLFKRKPKKVMRGARAPLPPMQEDPGQPGIPPRS